MLHFEKQKQILDYCIINNIRLINLEFYLTDPALCYYYAHDVLKSRFEIAEEYISKQGFPSFLYAVNVLKSRFELGEKAIKDAYLWNTYCDLLRKLNPIDE